MARRADVVVIGAGAAGLAAGRRLAESGRRVIIVEARDRIGGRILTRQAAPRAGQAGIAIELGAEFVHGVPPVTGSILHEAQLPSTELHGDAFCFESGRLERRDERQRAASEVMENMARWFERRADITDLSFEDYLKADNVDAASAERAVAYVEGFNAADRRVVSARALVRQQRAEEDAQGERMFHIRQGYDALPQYLAERLSGAGGMLLLDHPVRQIQWTPGSVSVQGRSARGVEFRIDAPQAIVALPLGVLKAGAVALDPLPADIARHWSSLQMGRAERISLLFDRSFWKDQVPGMNFLFAPDQLIPTWWTRAPDAAPLITGWAAGEKALARWQQAGVAGLPAVTGAAIATLANVFLISAGELRRRLLGAYYHDWQTDAFSQGAYSYVGVGGLEAARLLSRPLAGTLFFAGEHTDLEDQWGTVHAALGSGLRAAKQLMEGACPAAAAAASQAPN